MKRILSIILSLVLLFSPFAPILQQAQAEDVQVLVASGTVAAADIAVTLTAGSADVDLSSATIPRNYKGNLLKIYDAANVCIQGFPYTNGAGTVQNIVSTKGGTTRNWSQQGAGFDDTTNCRYEIWRILDAPVVATLNFTAGDLKLATVATGAMCFDVNAAPQSLAAYAGVAGTSTPYLLAFYDSSNLLVGAAYAGAVGGGEAYAEGELVVNGAFAADTNWNKEDGWSIAGTAVKVSGTGSVLSAQAAIALTVGALYKGVLDVTAGVSIYNYAFSGTGTPNFTSYSQGTGTRTNYKTCITVGDAKPRIFMQAVTGAGTFDNFSIQRVTDIPNTGLKLYSSKNGSTQSMMLTGSGNVNAITTVKCLYVGD